MMSMFRFAAISVLALVVTSLGACAAVDDSEDVATVDEAFAQVPLCLDRYTFETDRLVCRLGPPAYYKTCTRSCTLHEHLDDDGSCIIGPKVCSDWACDPHCPSP
jgi:hypothetical protein